MEGGREDERTHGDRQGERGEREIEGGREGCREKREGGWGDVLEVDAEHNVAEAHVTSMQTNRTIHNKITKTALPETRTQEVTSTLVTSPLPVSHFIAKCTHTHTQTHTQTYSFTHTRTYPSLSHTFKRTHSH